MEWLWEPAYLYSLGSRPTWEGYTTWKDYPDTTFRQWPYYWGKYNFHKPVQDDLALKTEQPNTQWKDYMDYVGWFTLVSFDVLLRRGSEHHQNINQPDNSAVHLTVISTLLLWGGLWIWATSKAMLAIGYLLIAPPMSGIWGCRCQTKKNTLVLPIGCYSNGLVPLTVKKSKYVYTVTCISDYRWGSDW
jgi:hypothetical protein